MILSCVAPSVGATWTTNGPAFKTMKVVAISPQHSNVVYAGAFGWGVFKSTNGGSTWVNSKIGMINTYVRSLLVLSDSLVYAGTNNGIYKTTNGGDGWNYILTTPFSVRSLALDARTGFLYGGSYGSGLYKSTNQGTTWTHITVTDLSTGNTLDHLWSVASFGKDSIYAGGSILDIPVNMGGAFFRSTDGGVSWFQMQYPLAIRSSVHSIAISPTTPTTTFLLGTAAKGVYLSSDGGLHFTNIDGTGTVTNPLPDPQINSVAFGSGAYFAGTDSLGRVYFRPISDVSNGWQLGSALPGNPAMVNSVKIDVTNSSTLYAGLDGQGVYKSTNGGSSWQSINSGLLGTAGRAVERNGNGNIILGTDFGDGIWISNDSARSWLKIDSLSTVDGITSFGITNNPSILYAGTFGGGVFKSTDAGHIWHVTDSTVINNLVRALSVHPSDPNLVYAGTGDGVYKTTNGGIGWFGANSGMPANTSIRSIALDRTNPTVLYAGTDSNYLYKTTNAGNSWVHFTSANGFLPQDRFIRSITIDYNSSGSMYIGSDTGRIYKSTNAGSNWVLQTQLPATSSVRSVLIHPHDHNVMFAATFGNGIFVSADSGGHWAPFNTGLTDLTIYTLESDSASPLNLYAGSGSTGVFHTTYSFSNNPPVLAPIGSKYALVGHALAFTVSATDVDLTIPTLSVHGLPSGASLFDSANGNARFNWTPTAAQIGNHLLTITASDGLSADSEAVLITVLDSTAATVVEVPLAARWNLVSVPVKYADLRRTTVFPTATTSGFFYDHGYVATDTLAYCRGYWLRFPAAQTIMLGGKAVLADTCPLAPGWNLVGSISVPVLMNGVSTIPTPTVLSNFYGYSNGYHIVDTLMPGKGYWVRTSGAADLVLAGPPGAAPKSQSPVPDLSQLNKLTISDASGNSQTLYFGEDLGSIDGLQLEGPPLPVADAFDARFASGQLIQLYPSTFDRSVEYPVRLSSMSYPVSVEWNIVRQGTVEFGLTGKGKITGSGRTSFSGDARIALSVTHEELPAQFALLQNYPNPFNPSTRIEYRLSSTAKVELKIFNLLGQELATLVDGVQDAGIQAAKWDAGNHSSGIYFYRLRATSGNAILYQAARPMFLLK